MAQTTNSRSDLLERAYEIAVRLAIRGVAILVVSAVLLWILKLVNLYQLWPVAALGMAAGVVIMSVGWFRANRARQRPSLPVYCTYCEHQMMFLAQPTEDYTCEGCHRRVQYENGLPVPVRDLTCPICRASHKVSVKAIRFTCDKCNRGLTLTDPNDPKSIVAEASDMMQNYDVILTQVGRNPVDVALALQDILVCNLPDARRQMEGLPLTLVRNVPERKADAIRRRIRELGATVVIRPTGDTAPRPSR